MASEIHPTAVIAVSVGHQHASDRRRRDLDLGEAGLDVHDRQPDVD